MERKCPQCGAAPRSPHHEEVDFYRADSWELARLRPWPLFPYFVEETIRHVPTWYRGRDSSFMMLVLLLSGRINYRCGDADFELVPGRLLLLPLGASYFFESESLGTGYHKLVLALKGDNVASIAETLGLNRPLLLDWPDGAGLALRFRELGALLRAQREADIPELVGGLFALLNQLAQMSRETPPHSKLLALAQARLESDLQRPLGVAQLAAELGVGRRTLDRLFQEKLGSSPQRFRTLRRLELARELLGDSSLSVKEIAAQVGYCNQFHFANEFRRHIGSSPSACRREGQGG